MNRPQELENERRLLFIIIVFTIIIELNWYNMEVQHLFIYTSYLYHMQ